MRSISFSVVAICLLALCVADDDPCLSQSLCHCTTADGEIDLTPLNTVSKVISSQGDEYFLFRPCSPFNQIDCKDAIVCRDTMSDNGTVVGQADGSKFIKVDGQTAVRYKAGDKTTNVVLMCNENVTADMTIEGEKPTNTFNLVLTSKYACLGALETTVSPSTPSSTSSQASTPSTSPNTPGSSTTPKSTDTSTTTPKGTGTSTTPKGTDTSTTTPKGTGSSTTTPKGTGTSTTPKGGSSTTPHGGSTSTPKGGSSTSPKTAPTGSTETTTQGASATSISFGLIAVIALVCRQFF